MWTKEQRKRLSVSMKAAIAKKKAGKEQKKFDFKPVSNMKEASNYLAQEANCLNLPAQTAAVDLNQMREYNYRRGLVTAMECILRELR